MAAQNAGRAISRKLHLRAHDLLVASNRGTSGDAYARLRGAVVAGDAPVPSEDALLQARTLRPGADVYALQADWQT